MNSTIENIFESGIYSYNGQRIKIHSETNKKQCEFLQELILKYQLKNSIEIGLAYGISTVAIIEAIQQNKGNNHVVIDKFQAQHWNNIGLDIISNAGYYGKFDFHEEYCYQSLGRYINENKKFDFAYIDSTKLFDWILVDFFLLDKLMEINGIIVFDDADFTSIRKVIRYIAGMPNYRVVAQLPKNIKNQKKQFLHNVIKLIPFNKHIFRSELVLTDYDLGINSKCIAIMKVNSDTRRYDWHISF